MRVVCIVGKGRSGSTLLDMLLGGLSGFVSAGELWHRRGYPSLEDLRCSCSQRADECAVWGQVLRQLRSRLGVGGFVAMEELEQRIHSWTKVPRLLVTKDVSSWPELEKLASYMEQTYSVLGDVTRAQVVVDSSKWPFHLAALGLLGSIECLVVHLVRDPRAVAYSWSKDRHVGGGLPRYGAVHSSLSWTARNLGAEITRRRHEHIVVRYEDLASNPTGALAPVLKWAGTNGGEVNESDPARPVHILAGNPMKTLPLTTIKVDDEWRFVMSRSARMVTWMVTGWLAHHYGYRWRNTAQL